MNLHSLLDGEQSPSPGDLALAGGLLVVSVLSGLYIDAARPDTTEPSSWWQWALICVPPVLVAFRRRHPVLIVLLGTIAQSAIWISDLPEVLLPMIVILYSAASQDEEHGLHATIAASLVLTAVTAIGVGVADDVTLYQLPLIALTCGVAVGLGANAARQRQRAAALSAAMAEAELRADHERSQAIALERSHIARELHDIIGHTLSVIAVRAEAADRVAERRPEAAHDAVGDIADAARSALSETRRILAGLQSTSAELAPPPDLAATCRLVDDVAGTGVDVTLVRTGCDEHTPSAVIAGGAHRIVQESLTNAIKHGGPSVSIVTELRCTEQMLDVTITNTLPKGWQTVHDPAESEGSGLTGMAERADVLGGTFAAGPEANGTFVVRAALPARAASQGKEIPR